MIFAFINLDKWNALPKSYQVILEHAAAFANNWMIAQYDKHNPASLRKLLAGGTKLHAFSAPIMEASYKAAMELHGEISKENASFKKVNDSMMDFTKNGYQWFQVAELAYDTFMIRKARG